MNIKTGKCCPPYVAVDRIPGGNWNWILALLLCGATTLASAADDSENTSTIYPSPASQSGAGMPILLKPGPQLLLDEFLIESSSNITRKVNMPMRDPSIPNPIVTGREDGCFQPYMTVIRDDSSKRFRLWYGIHTQDFNPVQSHIGYLESEDGIHWIRPHQVLKDPSPIQFGVSVIDEGPHFQNLAERFRFAWHKDGLRIATSPDGLAWTPLASHAVLAHNHDINGIFWDPIRKRYIATVSFYIPGPKWTGKRRVTKHSASDDLLHWSEPWLVLAPDDKVDDGETQFYAMDGYLARGDLIVGMVKVLRDDLKADQPPEPNDAYGIGYTSLAWTRDGEHWTRDREKFFDRHPQKGAWDHAHAWIDEQVLVGDEIYLYYAGYKSGHKVNRFEERQIGLVKMKRDRYVAREAGTEGGSFKTPLVKFDATAMTLNLEALAGEVTVQILDQNNRPVRGFTRKDCQPVSGNALASPVRWKNPLATLNGKPVRMEFFLKNARLFSFELMSGKP